MVIIDSSYYTIKQISMSSMENSNLKEVWMWHIMIWIKLLYLDVGISYETFLLGINWML